MLQDIIIRKSRKIDTSFRLWRAFFNIYKSSVTPLNTSRLSLWGRMSIKIFNFFFKLSDSGFSSLLENPLHDRIEKIFAHSYRFSDFFRLSEMFVVFHYFELQINFPGRFRDFWLYKILLHIVTFLRIKIIFFFPPR